MCKNCKGGNLFIAAERGHHRCLEILIQAKADVNRTESLGNKALMTAACYGHHECVDLLLKAGADLNVQKDWYCHGSSRVIKITALMLAAQHGHQKCMDVLSKAGAG